MTETHGPITLHHQPEDGFSVLASLPDASVDAVVTDPPYLLGFMGRQWDSHREINWHEQWVGECLRVLKPGGHLLAFGGTRTWHRLACAVEDAGFEMRDSIAWMYGSGFPKSLDVSKAIDKAAGAEREVVGRHVQAAARRDSGFATGATGLTWEHDITAPATPDAERWQGWGTALKPGHEPVVVAQKPPSIQGILGTIGSHLDTLETAWRAQEAAPITPTGEADASPAPTATSQSESATPTSSSTVMSWRKCWAELCDLTSTSTTATTSETTTVLRTLSSSLSRLTDESTRPSATSQPGSTSLASAVDNLFASAVCGLRATLALSATAPATASTPHSSRGAAGSSPAFEPVIVARKPLAGTVAANVLAHGTGALNIDGCRTETRDRTDYGLGNATRTHGGIYGTPTAAADFDSSKGRWPANVVLDEAMAGELDQMSGEGESRRIEKPAEPTPNHRETYNGANDGSMGGARPARGHTDSGGASRFFYVAKADASERVRVDGIAHPTVKPLALMRWLVRLVAPPGGTVLEPFAGSGTTVEACLLEGFRCVAIEREADYLPLIRQRIHRRRDPVEAVKATGEDGGLFDLLGEGA